MLNLQPLTSLLMWVVLMAALLGCTGNDTSPTEISGSSPQSTTAAIEAVATPSAPAKQSGIEFDGTGVAKTQAIYDGHVPVLIEATVTAKSAIGEQAILSNCQVSGFSLSIKDGHWTFYWHDGVKYKSISAPATLGKRTHLLGIVENSRMELRVDGAIQGMTRSDGHRQSKLPFYIAADPKLDTQYNYDPTAFEYPFTGVIYDCRISSDPTDIALAKAGNKTAKSDRAFLHYVFDTSGDKVIDRSTHKNNATIENGRWLP